MALTFAVETGITVGIDNNLVLVKPAIPSLAICSRRQAASPVSPTAFITRLWNGSIVKADEDDGRLDSLKRWSVGWIEGE